VVGNAVPVVASGSRSTPSIDPEALTPTPERKFWICPGYDLFEISVRRDVLRLLAMHLQTGATPTCLPVYTVFTKIESKATRGMKDILTFET
jgi:hypothetical protein